VAESPRRRSTRRRSNHAAGQAQHIGSAPIPSTVPTSPTRRQSCPAATAASPPQGPSRETEPRTRPRPLTAPHQSLAGLGAAVQRVRLAAGAAKASLPSQAMTGIRSGQTRISRVPCRVPVHHWRAVATHTPVPGSEALEAGLVHCASRADRHRLPGPDGIPRARPAPRGPPTVRRHSPALPGSAQRPTVSHSRRKRPKEASHGISARHAPAPTAPTAAPPPRSGSLSPRPCGPRCCASWQTAGCAGTWGPSP